MVGETNDLRPGIRRIGEGLRAYYEIVYHPPTPLADGRFREIEVKVARQGVTVSTRRGYTPFPSGVTEVLPYELPLATALEESPLPRAFDHRAVAFHFADGGDATETLVRVDVPLSELKFDRDEDARMYRAHYSLLTARSPTSTSSSRRR